MADRPTGRWRCDERFERELRGRGFCAVAGLDEAGRGALFGPVFAAAVILPPAFRVRGIKDSKALRPVERARLAPEIMGAAAAWAVAEAGAEEIDRINIYQASRLAMKRALSQLQVAPDFLLVDALEIDSELPQRALIKGDARCRSIAAASILAKVHRDECMRQWDRMYPQFGLARSKGYGTPEHTAALEVYGPTPQHRYSFEPVARYLPVRQLTLDLACRAEAGGRP